MTNDSAILVRNGMTPLQAIQSATSVAAKTPGQENPIGTVEVGRWADLVATARDPLPDIGALAEINVVMQGRKIVKQ